ncbi:hypothetical protein [uncultured Gilliamella sp.]|uniref:hypothetical protein n=1 Tax=uncultured Gilliamella sp. TaxID=1193505 RepID=UPI0025F69DCE|nr:hypothetical protein [uncultured Gilliamella sp.]
MKLTAQQKELFEFYELKAQALALDSKKPIGLCKNHYINEILEELNLNTTKNKKTYEQYLKTYKRLLKHNENIEKNEVNLLLHKAKTKATYDLYRTSIKFCLINEIKDLQKKSDEQRKKKNIEEMKEITNKAFELAVLLKEQFDINIQKPNFKKNNSKKKTLKKLENIENIINGLTEKQQAKYSEQLLVYSLFGLRPAELKKGIELKAVYENDNYFIEAKIWGAKVNKNAGQEERTCKTNIDFNNTLYKQFFLKILKQNVSGKKFEIVQTQQDYKALTQTLSRKYGKNVSLYSFRHKVASDLKKAKVDDDTIAKFLGHRTNKSQVNYGNYHQGSNSNKSFSATATHEIKHTKNKDFTYIYNKSRILNNNKTLKPY